MKIQNRRRDSQSDDVYMWVNYIYINTQKQVQTGPNTKPPNTTEELAFADKT